MLDDPDHFDILVTQFGEVVAKSASLLSASARHIGRIEIDNQNLLADMFLALPCFALIVSDFKHRSSVANLQVDRIRG